MNTATAAIQRMLASLTVLTLFLTLLLAPVARSSASEIARPVSPLGLSCGGCHLPGHASAQFAALDSLSADSIEASMKHFRDQPEPDSIMARFAEGLDDATIHRLAIELSKDRPTP